MVAKEALEFFLNRALIDKKSRYLGFVSKHKTEKKFLNSIYHELEACLDMTKQVETLPNQVLAGGGFKFKADLEFGEKTLSIKDAIDDLEDSFLIISADGRYAIHAPETFIDSRRSYAV